MGKLYFGKYIWEALGINTSSLELLGILMVIVPVFGIVLEFLFKEQNNSGGQNY